MDGDRSTGRGEEGGIKVGVGRISGSRAGSREGGDDGTHFPISFTATFVPSSDALYTFPKLPSPICVHSRLDDRSEGSKHGSLHRPAISFEPHLRVGLISCQTYRTKVPFGDDPRAPRRSLRRETRSTS